MLVKYIKAYLPLKVEASMFNRNLRSDNHFNAILVEAGGRTFEIDANKNFEPIPRHRVRQRKRQFECEIKMRP
ncbi:hypothetical protein AVEN_140822-1 [Araneus ventricosus]|uniref:Uncharacterized protein n=1 Tax=Araneus ventricosus TaxID=182803 RepID=A0A4Y2FP38_ARAVE|nr:hypothetical protein AVEN_140822-1 [Araneus ventricosus]